MRSGRCSPSASTRRRRLAERPRGQRRDGHPGAVPAHGSWPTSSRPGLVVGRRGRTGGYRLARPAERDHPARDHRRGRAGAAIQRDCVLRGGPCGLDGRCAVHDAFTRRARRRCSSALGATDARRGRPQPALRLTALRANGPGAIRAVRPIARRRSSVALFTYRQRYVNAETARRGPAAMRRSTRPPDRRASAIAILAAGVRQRDRRHLDVRARRSGDARAGRRLGARPAPSSDAGAAVRRRPSRSSAFDLGFTPERDRGRRAPAATTVTLKNTGAIPHDITFAGRDDDRHGRRRRVGHGRGRRPGRGADLPLLDPGPCRRPA